jgi:hypothetical protein
MKDTAAEKLAEAVEQAGLAYEFSPGSYTASALRACLVAKAALDGAVVMPKAVFDAADVLIGEFIIFHYRRQRDDRDLEAAVQLYEEWRRAHAAELGIEFVFGLSSEDEPDIFGETGGEETHPR